MGFIVWPRFIRAESETIGQVRGAHDAAVIVDAQSGIMKRHFEVIHRGEEVDAFIAELVAECDCVVDRFVPRAGFHLEGFKAALIAAIVIGLINATLGLLLKLITLPLTLSDPRRVLVGGECADVDGCVEAPGTGVHGQRIPGGIPGCDRAVAGEHGVAQGRQRGDGLGRIGYDGYAFAWIGSDCPGSGR